MNFIIADHGLLKDEKAWSLFEHEEQVVPFGHPGLGILNPFHRFQSIRVIRDGRLVQFDRDMGLASQYEASPFTVVSLGEDTVGACMDIADALRAEKDKGLKRAMNDHLESFNVVDAAILQAEQTQQYLRANPVTTRRIRRSGEPGRVQPRGLTKATR